MTQNELKQLLHYNPLTGDFTWLVTKGKVLAGSPAGYLHKQRGGYINIGINGKNTKAHRLAFLYMTGRIPEQVDHDDHDRSNNKWKNLLEANQTINSRNCTIAHNNISGVTGVHLDKLRERWVAQIWDKGKPICLGRFTSKTDAIYARKQAEKLYGYSVNHGNLSKIEPVYAKKSLIDYRKETITAPALKDYLNGISLSTLMTTFNVSKRLINWMENLAIEQNILPQFIEQRTHFKSLVSKKRGRILEQKIGQFTQSGEFITSYPSQIAAAKANNINQGNISNALTGRQQLAGGFKWERL